MKENLTSINVIIDASGSMQGLRNDTIGSFNTFLQEQKDVPGDAVFTLCTFNTVYHLVHDFVKLASVPDLSPKSYAPEGGTALLDAIGQTIDSVGVKLNALLEDEKPSKVIFLIITDGEENSSHHYTAEQVKNMVQHQKDVYNHEFVFMGANIDAITAGTNLGISTNNTLNYVPTSAGTHQLYNTISESMTSYRTAGVVRGASFFQPVDGSVEIDVAANNPVIPPTPVVTTITIPPVKNFPSAKKTIK
jgi:uncharacterized protein YegL